MIDTEGKRRAAVNVGFFTTSLPEPDGAIDVGDRATCCWVYAGLNYAAPSGGTAGWIAAILRRRRR